jgi:hypothetical protein
MSQSAHEVNFAGVTLAAVGTAVNDYALQFAGLLVTLLVAYWNSRAKKFDGAALQVEVLHQRDRADYYLRKCARQEAELLQLRPLPTAVSPPFPPGEACSDV